MSASPYLVIVPASLALGGLAGYLMHRSDFCIAGMFRDLFLFRRTTMLKALVLLVAASMVAFEGARLAGLLGSYPFPLLGAGSLANVLGGALFGVGMVLAGGCVAGTLYKLGAGSLLSAAALLGLIAGSALYAEVHGAWQGVVSALALGPAVTLPQAWQLPSWALITPAILALALLLARWVRRGELSYPAAAVDGYIQPWQAALGLAAVGLASYLLVGMPLGITTAYAKAGAFLEALAVPAHAASLEYFQAEGLRYVPPFAETEVSGGAGPRLDAIAAIQFPLILGIAAGAAYSARRLGEWKLRWRAPAPQYTSALIGGLLMGLAARMAPACNIWHLLGGLPVLAIQSLLFVAGLVPGAWLGSLLLTRVVLR